MTFYFSLIIQRFLLYLVLLTHFFDSILLEGRESLSLTALNFCDVEQVEDAQSRIGG